jgi:acyl-CoA thioesterase-1
MLARGVAQGSLGVAILALLAGCSTTPNASRGGLAPMTFEAPSRQSGAPLPGEAPIRYVALGDSYTIGTSVAEPERWPNQLVERLPALELVANLGVNGFTSRDVIEVELPQLDALRPALITVLIGVNDVVQGVSAETYRANVVRILDDAVDRVGASRVLVVTTPDYTVTPAGADYGDPTQQSAGIRENNAIVTEVARALGIQVVDIHDLSLRAADDRSLVAVDGLHPSGAQYGLWVDRIEPVLGALLVR